MASSDGLQHIRNIGIAAHIDAGKTTLTERILFYTGASHKIGEVHEGAAHMDFMEEERAHGITITSAVTRCPWNEHDIQVVDTPGHVDFTIEVERAMRVLDGAVVVMDGVRGVEPQTETVWRQASRFEIPRMFFVNKMDRPGASFDRALETMVHRLRATPVPICVPLPGETRLIDLVCRELISFSGDNGEHVHREPLSEQHAEQVRAHSETLMLAAAEADPELEEAVLEGEQIAPDKLWAALRTATISGRIHPVFGGSALRNWGVQPLLDGVVALLPSPLERPPVVGRSVATGEEQFVEMVDEGTLAALAFKVQLFEGRRHVFARIYRGTLEPGAKVKLAGKDVEERVARIFDIDANRKKRIDLAHAGEIVLLAGLRWASTGDTLSDPDSEVLLERIDAKEPVLGLAVEPESSRDEAKFLDVMGKICEEDPTLSFEEDADTGQRILKGMGELHLQIVFERIEREFGVKIRAGRPRVMTRETVLGEGTADTLLERLLKVGDKDLHLKARAVASVRALGRGEGIKVHIEPIWLPEGSSPTQAQVEAVRAGATDALSGGPVEGAPLQDLEVEIGQVELFDTASSPQALRIATSQAVREALVAAGGAVLRPVMEVEVVVPDENLGGVLGDLQSRGAIISGQESELGISIIHGTCPLQSLLGYTTELRSLTRGRGQFTMEFARFDVS